MKPKWRLTFKQFFFAAVLLVGIFLSFSGDFLDSNRLLKIPDASANAHLGILGQPAPELNLSTWIDGNGKRANSVRLSDYRGKVVYLYFFQDW